MGVQEDFREFLELLNTHEVKFIIAGGYASAFHGAPRLTGDIDDFVKPDHVNTKRIIDAIKPATHLLLDIGRPSRLNMERRSGLPSWSAAVGLMLPEANR